MTPVVVGGLAGLAHDGHVLRVAHRRFRRRRRHVAAGHGGPGLLDDLGALAAAALEVVARPEGHLLHRHHDPTPFAVLARDVDRLLRDAALDLEGAGGALLVTRVVEHPRLEPPGRLAHGLREDVAVAVEHARGDVRGGVEALVGHDHHPLPPGQVAHARLGHGRQQRGHVVAVAGEELVAQGQAVGVQEQPHLHDRAGPVLLGDAAHPEAVFLPALEVVVGDVVVQARRVARAARLLQRRVHRAHERVGVAVQVGQAAVDVVGREAALAGEPLPFGIIQSIADGLKLLLRMLTILISFCIIHIIIS